MRLNYFIRNGKTYNTGTIIIMRWFSLTSRSLVRTKAKFLYYNTETKQYVMEIYGKEEFYEEDRFNRLFVEIYNQEVERIGHNNNANKKHSFKDELNIDGLLIAWIWYVFVMAVAVIFYDRIAIWIVASIIFINYRKNKLKEAGYK